MLILEAMAMIVDDCDCGGDVDKGDEGDSRSHRYYFLGHGAYL